MEIHIECVDDASSQVVYAGTRRRRHFHGVFA
jgi:hypothetical protein